MTGRSSILFSKFSFVALGATLVLAGCENGEGFNPFKPAAESDEAAAPQAIRTIERDVESPEVFQKTDRGLWDGRPSLGGVWVAHPDVTDPERVIIRKEADGSFVIGALFRRERVTPGPAFQVSSDAAAALGMLAGQPATLNVTALRREEVVIEPEVTEITEDAAAPVAEAEEIEQTTLDPIEAATAAIDNVEANSTPAPILRDDSLVPISAIAAAALAETEGDASEAETNTEAGTEVEATTPASNLRKPFIQIGIFSVEGNAQETATSLRVAGMVPTIRDQSSNGSQFWRVLVGPATNRAERKALLNKARELGFDDAYYVTH